MLDTSRSEKAAPERSARAQAEIPLRRLGTLTQLTPWALDIVARGAALTLPGRRGTDLGAFRGGRRFLSSGWACLMDQQGSSGQILSILVPGDPVDQSLIAHERCCVVALTPVELVDFGSLEPVLLSGDAADAPIAAAFEAAAYAAQGQLIDHMGYLFCPVASEALLALFRHLHRRLGQVGLSDEEGFPMPLTQTQIGRALGLTVSHVNRTLSQMREDDVLVLSAERVRFGKAWRSTRVREAAAESGGSGFE